MTDAQNADDRVLYGPHDRAIIEDLRERMSGIIGYVKDRVTDEGIEERLRQITGSVDSECVGGAANDPPTERRPARNSLVAALTEEDGGSTPPPSVVGHPQTDTVLAAGTGFPRGAEDHRALGREVSRAADSVVEASGSLVVPGGDLRMMSDGDREETRAVIAEWRERLSACPTGTFGVEGSVLVLETVATLAETLIADRDEHTALRLIRAASPPLVFLGRRHPAVFKVRHVWAEALSGLGHHQLAETKLRRLSEDEKRVFGSADPWTTLLLNWALVGQGRLREAEDGFRSIEARLPQSQGAGAPMLRHLQCRRSWLLGQQGRLEESVNDYDGVIINRSHELDDHHPDTADARHSKGKILVFAGKGSQAVTLLRALARDRARVQGDRHTDTLETLKYLRLAQVQTEPHNDRIVDRAIRDLEEFLRIQDTRHGRDYPMSRDTAAWLGQLLHIQEAIRFREPPPDLRWIPTADKGQNRLRWHAVAARIAERSTGPNK